MTTRVSQGQVWEKVTPHGNVVILIVDAPDGEQGVVTTVADWAPPDFSRLSPYADIRLTRAANLPPAGCTLVQTLPEERCRQVELEVLKLRGGFGVRCGACGELFYIGLEDETLKGEQDRLVRCATCRATQGRWADA